MTGGRPRPRSGTSLVLSGRTLGRLTAAAFLAVVALVATAGPAAAHAELRSTSPGDREQVATAPEHVVFEFSEPVTTAPGALRVFDRDGARVDNGIEDQPDAASVRVGIGDLADGGYVATYLVTSVDGHVVRGATTFQVGQGAALEDDVVASLFASGTSPLVGVIGRVATGVQFGAALLALGALLPLLRHRRATAGAAVGPEGARFAGTADDLAAPAPTGLDAQGEHGPDVDGPDMDAPGRDGQAGADIDLDAAQAETARAVASTMARWGAVAALVLIPLQAMTVTGQGFSAILSMAVLTQVATSSVGVASLTLVAGLVLVAALARRPGTSLQAGAAAILVVASFLLTGHTMSQAPRWLLLLADAVHVGAAAVWAGGLVVVVMTWRRVGRAATPAALARMVARFSGDAIVAMAAVAVAGGALTWALARAPRALVTTSWGWALLGKVALVAVVVAVAAYNRWRLVPLVEDVGPTGDAARAQLSSTMRAEVVLLVAVLAVTSVLTGLRPAAAEAGITGAFDTVVAIDDDLSVNLVVDPNRAGANQVHLYLLDETGRPTSEVEDVTLELTQVDEDLGPILRTPAPSGPGHWILSGSELAIPGRWEVVAVVGIDRFTEERVAIEVVVNPS